jgi:hypothetical protein
VLTGEVEAEVNQFSVALTVQGTVRSLDPQSGRCEVVLRSGDMLPVQFHTETLFAVSINVDRVDRDKVPDRPASQPNDTGGQVAKIHDRHPRREES